MTDHPATRTAVADLAADLILYNGRVVTVDEPFSIADAIAITNGRIVGIGRGEELRSLGGPRTETVDLKGHMAMPGLNNSHGHPYRFGLREPRLNLMECRSVQRVLDTVQQRTAQTPVGGWVEAGIGWREDWLADLIVLDRDILTCPVDEIKDTEVLATLLGGRVVHGGFEAL